MGASHKKNTSLFTLGLLLLLVASCSQELTYNEAINKNKKNFDDPQLQEDALFLVEARSFNLLETELVNLAIESGYASTVVELGRKNSVDHQSMKEELEKLARNKKIKLPSEMNEEHQRRLDEVARSSRGDFDKNFLRSLKRVNEENKNKFLDMATDAHDPDIRAFSARNLDMLRAHSENIKEVEDELLSTY